MENKVHLPNSHPSVMLWFPGRKKFCQSVEAKELETMFKKRLRGSERKTQGNPGSAQRDTALVCGGRLQHEILRKKCFVKIF